jgi:hypothetical protein
MLPRTKLHIRLVRSLQQSDRIIRAVKDSLSTEVTKGGNPFEGDQLRPHGGIERQSRTNTSCQSEVQAQHEVPA